ncbi:hypothetical protein BDZ45DRAFT_747569 [Acephala macrosclerotiorum]|nr:hypothetical protein BDZ45DRAFT_747569 [Acephala macrosclerotiorum]
MIGKNLFWFAATVVSIAAAHGGTSNYTADGVWYRGYTPDEPAARRTAMARGKPHIPTRQHIPPM